MRGPVAFIRDPALLITRNWAVTSHFINLGGPTGATRDGGPSRSGSDTNLRPKFVILLEVETPAPDVATILTGSEGRSRQACRRPRGTRDWLLIHTTGGEASAELADGEHALRPGDTILWRPGTPQHFRTDSSEQRPWTLIWAHFHPRPAWHEWLTWPRLAGGVLWMPAPSAPLLDRITLALADMNRYAQSGVPRADHLAFNCLEAALLWLDAANPEARGLDERVLEALLFASRHIAEPIGVGELARAVHLSKSRLAHLFSEQVGVSPQQFVERQRLERAKQLLESSSMPITAIAQVVGFTSQAYFSTRFKMHTGRTPTEYRGRDERVGA